MVDKASDSFTLDKMLLKVAYWKSLELEPAGFREVHEPYSQQHFDVVCSILSTLEIQPAWPFIQIAETVDRQKRWPEHFSWPFVRWMMILLRELGMFSWAFNFLLPPSFNANAHSCDSSFVVHISEVSVGACLQWSHDYVLEALRDIGLLVWSFKKVFFLWLFCQWLSLDLVFLQKLISHRCFMGQFQNPHQPGVWGALALFECLCYQWRS